MPTRAVKQRLGLASAFVLITSFSTISASPFVPPHSDYVLEELPRSITSQAAAPWKEWRKELAQNPNNLPVALRLARFYLEKGREEAEPRYTGYAQSALSPWWSRAKPPIDVLVLRAVIRQRNHDFSGALKDLEQVLARDPHNAQAWLSQASIMQVQSNYEGARQSCLALWQLTSRLLATAATANVASLNGEALKSYSSLQQALSTAQAAPPHERIWALTILADVALRLGKPTESERYFKEALALGQEDTYLLGAYADFLLDQGQPKEVVTLLKEKTRADALLLRLAIAENKLQPGGTVARSHIAMLQDRFQASRIRGDKVHLREEARFTLELLNNHPVALALAQENWLTQREPADARVFLESAVAAQAPHLAQPVLDWIATNKVEDVNLHHLSLQLTDGKSMRQVHAKD